MNAAFQALAGGFHAEALSLGRARLFVALTVIQAVTFLFLVSLFGLTGSRAPTAVVSEDRGAYVRMFLARLASDHHSFALKPMAPAAATAALKRGELVAILTIPADFSATVARGGNAVVTVAVDNVNTDMTDDIQRALPSTIVAFGAQARLPGIRLRVAETDLIPHDTGFIPYLVVSGLVLDAFVIAGILGGVTVAREFEAGTVRMLWVAPVPALIPLAGRGLATMAVSAAALALPAAVVVFGYRVVPRHPLEAAGDLLLSLVTFGCLGVAAGALLKRTLPTVTLIFGLALPLYVGSGALEPQRFDGEGSWALAHLSPAYPAIGILEHAFHGFQVTPESVAADFSALLGWAAAMLALAGMTLGKRAASE